MIDIREYLWGLWLEQDGCCAYTGVRLHVGQRHAQTKKKDSIASLDRIDSSRGYEAGNVQWVHPVINQMKSDLTEQEFLWWCRTVARFDFLSR